MANDKVATYQLGFTADDADFQKVLSAFKSSTKSALTELQATASKIDIFKSATAGIDTAQKAFKDAQDAAKLFADQVEAAKKAGDGVGVVLAESLKTATKAAKDAGTELAKQQSTVAKLSTQLKAAGVNTASLATEQIRLALALKQAGAAAELNAAKQKLGVKTLADAQPEIRALQAAFQTLKSSGTASGTEIAAAWINTRKAIAEAKSDVTGLGSIFASLRGPATAVAVSLAAAGAAVVSVASKFQSYSDALQRGATVTNVTKKELDALSEGARNVAREFGEDAKDAIAATFELIRSGVPKENAITALRDSAEAAQANFTSLGTVVSLGTTILNAYGKTSDELPKILDQIAVAAHAGGFSFDELKDSIGSVLPIAKAAHVPLDEIVATLTALRKGGLDAGSSVQVLQKLIKGFADPDTVSKLREAGISVTGLVDTLKQIGSKDFDLSKLATLGFDAKALKGLTAATSQYQFLDQVLDAVRNKYQGVNAASSAAVDKTHADSVKRLAAEWQNLLIALGEFSANSGILKSLTKLIGYADDLVISFKRANQELEKTAGQYAILNFFKNFGDAVVVVRNYLTGFTPTVLTFNEALTDAGVKASAAAAKVSASLQSLASESADAVERAKARVAQSSNDLAGFAKGIADDITAIKAAQSESIKGIDETAKAAIAALQLQNLSREEIAQQTVAIETKAAADRLEVLRASSIQVTALFEVEAAARIKVAVANGDDVVKVEQQISAERKQAIGDVVAAYKDQIAQLTALETNYLNQYRTIEEKRAAVNADVQSRITGIQAQSLSAYEQYGVRVQQIESLLAQAREANAAGNATLAEKFATQALNLANSVSTAVRDNGQIVVSAQNAQTTAVDLTKKAALELNKAFDAQGGAAKKGADDIAEQLKKAQGELKPFADQYKDLQTEVQKGLNSKVDLDVSNAVTTLGILTGAITDLKRYIQVDLDVKAAQAAIVELQGNLKKGITAGAAEAVTDINALLTAVGKDAPELKLKTEAAKAQVKELSTTVTALGDLKLTPQVIAKADTADATKALNELTKDRTVVIHQKFVSDNNPAGDSGGSGGVPAGPPGFRLGGLVGNPPAQRAFERVMQFAKGGPVFRGPKVPGSGDGDTYGTRLESGSFVIRKAASKYYGDNIMRQVARFAYGGLAGSSNDYIGSHNLDIGGSERGAISVDLPYPDLPEDQFDRIWAILNYNDAVVTAARQIDPGLFDNAIDKAQQQRRIYEQRPTENNLLKILDTSRSIGLNLGLSKGEKVGFDVDGRRWHKGAAIPNGYLGLGGSLGNFWEFYAKGGHARGADTIPAMLTPGEFVINRASVSRLGTGFLESLNAMRIPKGFGESLGRAPRVRHYADGGLVAGTPGDVAAPRNQGGGSNTTINMNVSVTDILSEANIRRHVVPALERISRRSP